jgi:hypothetical protein
VIAYLDSSVILRPVLGQPAIDLTTVHGITATFTSVLTELECRRSIDGMRVAAGWRPARVIGATGLLREALAASTLLGLFPATIRRAGDPMPSVVRTLDALHIATALALRDRLADGSELAFATHDRQQGAAAASLGFEVIGLDP